MAAPLRLNPVNPRYFADPDGRAVLLTGFHTWNNLVDIQRPAKPTVFDFPRYLDLLEEMGHNFIRLWAWDALCSWDVRDRVGPFPWARIGQGEAIDGLPKLDLETFDESYFARLRERVAAAEARGIYVGVMLFESWAASEITSTPFDWHAFAKGNNVNGVDVEASVGNSWLLGWMALADPQITAIQERYVERVVHDLNGFGNVIFEISNEAGRLSFAWQQHMVRHIRAVEAALPNRHLVGISGGMGTSVDSYFELDADYLAPEGWVPEGQLSTYCEGQATWGEPPERAKGPVLLDTDHLWGIGGNVRWAWMSFLRGYHPLYMDRCDDLPWAIFEHPWWPDPSNVDLRRALGTVQRTASLFDLNDLFPGDGYALRGTEGAIALSVDGAPITLHPSPGEYELRWIDPVDGRELASSTIQGVGPIQFLSPIESDGVAVLRRTSE